jgi:hypothetical protein
MKLIFRRLIVAIATLSLLAAASAARAQVLDQIPSNALLVLKVKNLSAASAKVAKFANDLGVAQMAPPLADPLGALQDHLKIKDGLDKNGDLALAYFDPATVTDVTEERSLLLVLPVTDYKAFLGNFPDAKTQGDVTQVTAANDPQPAYVANWGNYAVIAESKMLVSTKPTTALKPPAASQAELDAKDFVLYANVAALRDKLRPLGASAKDSITQLFEMQFKSRPGSEKYVPIVDAIIGQVFAAYDSFLRDADGATASLNLDPEGVSVAFQADFQPQSYLGKFFSQIKNTSDSLLTGLPQGKYLISGGLVLTPAATTQMLTDCLAPIEKAAEDGGPDLKPVSDAIESMKTAISSFEGENFGMLNPNLAQAGQQSLIQMMAVITGDAPTIKQATEKAQASQQALMQSLGLPGMDGVKMTATPNAKTVDGVTFDSMVTAPDPNATSPAAAQQAKMMQLMYGPQGMVVYSGVLDPKHMLVAGGVDDTQISSLIAAAKAQSAPLADNAGIKSVAANLPTSRFEALYIDLGDLVGAALGYAKQMGLPVQVQLPPDLPPVGVAVSTQQSALRVETYTPTSLIQALVAAGMQGYMQMQGGGGGGGL